MDKFRTPIVLRAAALALTGVEQIAVGTVSSDNANAVNGATKVGNARYVCVRLDFARGAMSAAGRPIIAVEFSMDSPDTAPGSVGNWTRPQLLDGASFTAGSIQSYPQSVGMNPSAATATYATHPIDVSCVHWIRVVVSDVDGAAPGSVTNVVIGGTL